MSSAPHPSDYDPFGDPAASSRSGVSRRARNVAVAVFWSVALMLVAGRVYQHNLVATPQAHTIAVASR